MLILYKFLGLIEPFLDRTSPIHEQLVVADDDDGDEAEEFADRFNTNFLFTLRMHVI